MTCQTCGRVHDCPRKADCHLPADRHGDRCNTFDPDGHP